MKQERLERISGFKEIQGDCDNFVVDYFDFCDEIQSQISMGWDFRTWDGEAYELSYTDPETDPEKILGTKPEIADWDEFILGLYDKFYTLEGCLRRQELFGSDLNVIYAYKKALELYKSIVELER